MTGPQGQNSSAVPPPKSHLASQQARARPLRQAQPRLVQTLRQTLQVVLFSVLVMLVLGTLFQKGNGQQTEAPSVNIAGLSLPPQEPLHAEVTLETSPPPAPSEEEQKMTFAKLNQMLPAWMPKEERFSKKWQVLGHTILQSRGRHHWQDGEFMEISLFDMGPETTTDLVAEMGFNLKLVSSSTDSHFVYSQKDDGIYLNAKYHHADQSGWMQLLVEDRYIVEVTIEDLPVEAFQTLLDEELDLELLTQA